MTFDHVKEPDFIIQIKVRFFFNIRFGEAVCKSGNYSGATCGTLQTRNFSIDIEGSTFFNLRAASTFMWTGDSGGTVYADTVLKGVAMGFNANYPMYYSHVGNVNRVLGLTPIFK
ncbi:hypothetical protein IQ10_01319 [Halalkalibacter nanhaiisediminis]|uniref:Uncharacterized protein n=1 Tax=Halalkalibacter nanhaiisediminis TaxID=688079 RepID=A0A562QML0_9BACI|nr:hypothetical protein IQ10_01319 [Halalkalibacter nanhaiisediminis]